MERVTEGCSRQVFPGSGVRYIDLLAKTRREGKEEPASPYERARYGDGPKKPDSEFTFRGTPTGAIQKTDLGSHGVLCALRCARTPVPLD
jgi:hypothetical protein